MLKDDPTFLNANHPEDNTTISITATLKHIKKMSDSKSIQFFNTLFRRIMFSLKMVQMNKNFYDPRTGHVVPQHKLKIFPGYVTAVQELEFVTDGQTFAILESLSRMINVTSV